MVINKINNHILLFLFLMAIDVFSQNIIMDNSYSLNVQPYPKRVEALDKVIITGRQFIPVYAVKTEEKKAANYFKYIFQKRISTNVKVDIRNSNSVSTSEWEIKLSLVDYKDSFINNQYYSIQCLPIKKEISISSPSQLGLLYGVVTFSKFISNDSGKIKTDLFNVVDWPAYIRRGVSAVFKLENVDNLLDFALMNKIGTVAMASRIYPWYKIDRENKAIIGKIKNWKDRFGGPRIMQMQNIYDKKQIEISNPADIDSLEKIIKLGIEYGTEEVMILADDTPPFKFSDGYVLTRERDKQQFGSMATAHCYLMKKIDDWIKANNYDVELSYVPPFYTYEDMHYGAMDLYKNTPWEKDAFQPLTDFLSYVGLNMPDDVFIVWCGPNVRSRKITIEDLNDWTNRLKGRIPFLWDNTIYSHFPFTSTPLFSAWDNDLPVDFYKITAGNGMFINGNANAEDFRVTEITAIDYLWDPENYNPEKSLNTAMENYYGKNAVKLLFNFKDAELNLRKKIGERKLWFEADTLWTIIRKTRFITDKNPEYYQQNYNELKALRLQLKYSVPEPGLKEDFIKECIQLDKKRSEIITQLSKMDKSLAERIKAIMRPLPDFNSIQ
jgi:hypothetical protein